MVVMTLGRPQAFLQFDDISLYPSSGPRMSALVTGLMFSVVRNDVLSPPVPSILEL